MADQPISQPTKEEAWERAKQILSKRFKRFNPESGYLAYRNEEAWVIETDHPNDPGLIFVTVPDNGTFDETSDLGTELVSDPESLLGNEADDLPDMNVEPNDYDSLPATGGEPEDTVAD